MKKQGVTDTKILSAYFFRQCGLFSLGLFLLFFGQLASLVVPWFIGQIIDLMKKQEFDDIGYYCFLMMFVCLVSAFSSGARGTTFNTMSETIAKELRYDIFNFLIHKDVAFFDENKTGDILSRISADT